MNLFEVFEELQVKPELESIFREVEVEKITASHLTGNTFLHLKSRHLLEFRHVNEMEQLVKNQYFGKVGPVVKLEVTYQLSGQYTPESLWNMYKESVYEELGKESRMASFPLKIL